MKYNSFNTAECKWKGVYELDAAQDLRNVWHGCTSSAACNPGEQETFKEAIHHCCHYYCSINHCNSAGVEQPGHYSRFPGYHHYCFCRRLWRGICSPSAHSYG